MKLPSFNRIVFYFFIIGCLYIIQLSSHSEKYSVKSYSDLEQMLQNEKLDLVSICTPSGIHSSQAILCANYGVNVITEKPMATTWEDGLKMVDACNIAEVKLFVVKQYRQLQTLKTLKKAIDEFVKKNELNVKILCENRFAKIQK